MVKRDRGHWIADEKTRGWFYQYLKDTFCCGCGQGLSGEKAKELLGIKSFYECESTGNTRRDIEKVLAKLEEEGPGW